jgi:hypothetical protein
LAAELVDPSTPLLFPPFAGPDRPAFFLLDAGHTLKRSTFVLPLRFSAALRERLTPGRKASKKLTVRDHLLKTKLRLAGI